MSIVETALTVVGSGCLGAAAMALRERYRTRTAEARAQATVIVERETTGQHAIARDVALLPDVLKRLEAVEAQARADREEAQREREECRAENDELRRLATQADERATRAEARCEVLERELARWHGAVPAGSD